MSGVGSPLMGFGTTAGTACQGNDVRLSDARTPTAHRTSHEAGGSDAVRLITGSHNQMGTGSTSSTSSGFVIATQAAAAGTELVDFSVIAITPTDGISVKLTFSDASTETISVATPGALSVPVFMASRAGLLGMGDAGKMTTFSVANFNKAITQIDVLTNGTGAGTKTATISAYQVNT